MGRPWGVVQVLYGRIPRLVCEMCSGRVNRLYSLESVGCYRCLSVHTTNDAHEPLAAIRRVRERLWASPDPRDPLPTWAELQAMGKRYGMRPRIRGPEWRRLVAEHAVLLAQITTIS